MNIKKKLLAAKLTILIGLISSFLVTSAITPRAVVAAPFTCDNNFYQVINGTLTVLDPMSGDYTTIGSTGSLNTNAIGFNTEDNYIYGWQQVDPFLQGDLGIVRIEDDGTTTFVGLPSGMPTSGPGSSFVSGDFDTSGNLYVYAGTTTLWQVDISTLTATPITLTSAVGVNDLVYVNGTLYGINNSSLFKIDPLTGTVTTTALSITPDPNSPNSVYGAGWGANNNSLFFARNSDGLIFEIKDFAGSTPEAVPVLGGQSAAGNDGAACISGRSPIPPLYATDDSYRTTQNTALVVVVEQGLLNNDSGRQITVTSFTQPAHGTVMVNTDGSLTYTPTTGFSGNDSFSYTITDEYGETRTATVSVVVTAPDIKLADTGISQALTVTAAVLLLAGGVLCLRIRGTSVKITW